jgi:hypothetical protein
LGRDFNDDDFLALARNDLNARGERRPGSVGDEGRQADWVGSPGFVTGSGAGNAAVIFHADE